MQYIIFKPSAAARAVDVTFCIERARIMYHYLNGTIYYGIITRCDIKFVMDYFNSDIYIKDELMILEYKKCLCNILATADSELIIETVS